WIDSLSQYTSRSPTGQLTESWLGVRPAVARLPEDFDEVFLVCKDSPFFSLRLSRPGPEATRLALHGLLWTASLTGGGRAAGFHVGGSSRPAAPNPVALPPGRARLAA